MFDVYLQTYDSYRHRTSKGESKEEEECFQISNHCFVYIGTGKLDQL